MGGAIILIALFGQNYILEQQHNMSQSCDLVCYTKKYKKIAWLYEKDPKEIHNNIIETTKLVRLVHMAPIHM